MKTISVGIVDDHALTREGLSTMLARRPDFRFTRAVSNGAELRTLMDEDPPDVILMDIKLGDESGLELTKSLMANHPDLRVIILSNFDEGPFVIEAISVGAVGYLLKDCSSSLLFHTICAVTDGGMLFKKELLEQAFSAVPRAPDSAEATAAQSLTEDELEILALMATGARNRAIGIRLHLSEATVKKRVQSILSKLNVSNRTEAVALATRTGVISSA
ncbi:MAG: response regulator transcription factor [Actinomycetes bacterium]